MSHKQVRQSPELLPAIHVQFWHYSLTPTSQFACSLWMCDALKEYDALIHSDEDHVNVSLPLSWVDCSMALWVAYCDLDSHVNDALDKAELGQVVL